MRARVAAVFLALGALGVSGCAESPPAASPAGVGAWQAAPANTWNGSPAVAQDAPRGGPPIQGTAATTPPPATPSAVNANAGPQGAAAADAMPVGEGEEVPFSTGGTGTVEPGRVRQVLRGAMPSFVSCYQRALTKTPSLRGKFAVRFRIEPDGTVRKATTTGPAANPEFQGCVTDAIRGLPFPKPRGGAVEVVYPLTFESD